MSAFHAATFLFPGECVTTTRKPASYILVLIDSPSPPMPPVISAIPVSYTHLRAHETRHDLVCRLLLEKKGHLRYLHLSIRRQRQMCIRDRRKPASYILVLIDSPSPPMPPVISAILFGTIVAIAPPLSIRSDTTSSNFTE